MAQTKKLHHQVKLFADWVTRTRDIRREGGILTEYLCGVEKWQKTKKLHHQVKLFAGRRGQLSNFWIEDLNRIIDH